MRRTILLISVIAATILSVGGVALAASQLDQQLGGHKLDAAGAGLGGREVRPGREHR